MRSIPLKRLALCIAVLLAANAARAQESTESREAGEPAAQELDAVTVTAARLPAALSDIPTSVSQIDAVELGTQLAIGSNILESLDALVPGMTVSQEEARLGCNTNIRGRQAQFLINGVPTNDNLRRSSCSSLFAVSPFALEQVDVLRGATALFGAGAPGGAINLITRQGRTPDASFDLVMQTSINPHDTAGSSESNLYAGVGQDRGSSDYYLGLGVQDYGLRRNPEGGILPGEESRSWSLNTSLGWDIGSGRLRFTGLHFIRNPDEVYGTDFTQVSGEQLAGSAFVAQPPNPYAHQAEHEQSVLTLSYDAEDVLGHTLNLSAYRHDERLVQRAADFFAGEVFYFDSDAENERTGLRATLNREFQLGDDRTLDIAYGLDWLKQRYYRPQVDPAEGGRVIGYIAPEVMLTSTAVFVQPTWRSGRWLVTGGIRHEAFRGEVGDQGYDPAIPRAATPGDTPDFSLTLFNLGAVFDLRDDLQLFGGFSQGAEISEFGRAARGATDPALINLEAASSDQVEIGVRGRQGRLDFSLSAFHSRSDKAASLQFDPSCAGQPICPLIPLRLEQRIHGIEATADWALSARTRLGGTFTWQDGKANPPGATPVPFGTDTLSPPRATAYLAFEPVEGWSNRLQASYSSDWNQFSVEEEALGLRDAESVLLVDFQSSFALGPGRASIGVSNLLNHEYVNVTNQASGDFFYYLSEGTRLTLGYEMKF